MKKVIFTGLCIVFTCSLLFAQPIQILTGKNKISLRGLSVVNDNICWASGSKGSIVKTIDGGKNFEWMTVKGYEQRDFRDIEAFDANTAIIMAVAEPAIILKTKDGGKNWYEVFEDSTKGMFLDAMNFDGKNGVVIGDPLGDNIFTASTHDNGETWNVWHGPLDVLTVYEKGEAFFAASGTNIKLSGKGTFWVTGGIQSHIYQWEDIGIKRIPIIQGKESTGANSIDIYKDKGIIVGGDFAKDTISENNCVLFSYINKKFSFSHPQNPPHGYRSCVIYVNEKTLITCGTSGVDISHDGGMNWQLISNESFHVVQKAKQGSAIFMAGINGRIAKVEVQ